jgi:hypothetical protein
MGSTIAVSSPARITRVNHQLEPNYQITFRTTGTLPDGLSLGEVYFVLPDGFTDDSFQVSLTKNGTPAVTTGAGSGIHSYVLFGLARTTLRENYNYIELSVWGAQPYAASPLTCTITVASPAVVTTSTPHGFVNRDVIRFSVSGGGEFPGGILGTRHYFVANIISPTEFTVDSVIGGSVELATI